MRDDPEQHDPDVCAEIERWWLATKPLCNKQTAALGREEYEMFYARLVFAFNHDDDEQNDLDPKQVLEALEVDWGNDSAHSTADGNVDEVFCSRSLEYSHL